MLKTKQAVLVVEKGRAVGIITRHDVIKRGRTQVNTETAKRVSDSESTYTSTYAISATG